MLPELIEYYLDYTHNHYQIWVAGWNARATGEGMDCPQWHPSECEAWTFGYICCVQFIVEDNFESETK